MKIISFLIILVIVCLGIYWNDVFASTTIGTIDLNYKYAWSDQVGWINFAASSSNVVITDTALTGYIWSDNFSWVILNASSSGVTNDGNGNLSGNAWGEQLGWISFENVSISTQGKFSGVATGTIIGNLNFDCTNCDVRTDWRPVNIRPTTSGYSPSTYGGPAISQQNGNINIDGKVPTKNVGVFSTSSIVASQSECPKFIRYLKFGSRGGQVKMVQQFLKDEGSFNLSYTTDYFGPITDVAVKRFQEKYRKDILEPSNLKKPTGNWYKYTIEKANKLSGCL